MQIGEWVGLGGLIITNAGAVYLTYDNFNKKIDRIYERFDEYKKHIESVVEEKFVQKDLCKVMHANNSENLDGLELRLTQSLVDLKKQVDENFKVVIELMKK